VRLRTHSVDDAVDVVADGVDVDGAAAAVATQAASLAMSCAHSKTRVVAVVVGGVGEEEDGEGGEGSAINSTIVLSGACNS